MSTANIGTLVVILGWTLLAISTIVIGARVYTKYSRGRFAADDHLMVASWLSELFHMVFITMGWNNGLGRHFATLTPAERQAALFYSLGLCGVFALLTCMLGRISFSVFLLYIIGPTSDRKRVALWSVIGLQIVVTVVTIVQIYTQCGTHVAALWDFAVASRVTCQSLMVQTVIGYVQSSVNSACDIALTVLPWMILWQLNMPLWKKLELAAVLTLSVFAFGASIAKLVQIHHLSAMGDITWSFSNLQLWVIVEDNVVMVAASIPTLRPLFQNIRRPIKAPKYYTSSYVRRPGRPRDPYEEPSGGALQRTVTGQQDGNSEEYILDALATPPEQQQQIMKTMDVCVNYEASNEATRREARNDNRDSFLRSLSTASVSRCNGAVPGH